MVRALIGWVIIAALYTWVGKWLGGTGKFSDMILITPASAIPFNLACTDELPACSRIRFTTFEVPTDNFGITNLPIGRLFIAEFGNDWRRHLRNGHYV